MKRLLILLWAAASLLGMRAQTFHNTPLSSALHQIQDMAKGEIFLNYEPSELAAFTVNCSIDGLKPIDAVKKVIGWNPVKISKNGRYLTLQPYTVVISGQVIDENDRPVEDANIAVYSLADSKLIAVATADDAGRFSTDLPRTGNVKLSVSRQGYLPAEKLSRPGNAGRIILPSQPERLNPVSVDGEVAVQLSEVVVNGAAINNLNSSRMGSAQINSKMLLSLPTLFGEPDVVKTLHTLPGVTQGTEGFTGLFVHGGQNDQNMFLYEGLPLYHVSHIGGIFSAFNGATIRNIDFFKSSFPASYGGRVSSISDIAMQKPDFERFTGRFTLGLLSGNAYISGPIIKGKTAFSAALRRSWVDVLSIPTLAIINATKKKEGDKLMAHYAFTDFNARIDHKLGRDMSLKLIGYYGNDNFNIGKRRFNPQDDDTDKYFDENTNYLAWGNWGIIGTFNWNLERCGSLEASLYTSNYSSKYEQKHDWQSDLKDPDTHNLIRSNTRNAIHDLGAKARWTCDLAHIWQPTIGLEYVHHNFLPEGLTNYAIEDGKPSIDINSDSPHVHANEFSAFIDNDFNITSLLAVNAGLRFSAFAVQGKTHTSLEPRASARLRLGDNYSVKLGYSRMAQFVQQVSSNYIVLPTDLWLPVTPAIKPLTSDQYSVGFYGNLPYEMYFSVEGWYRDMQNLLEYREGTSVLSPGLTWEEKLTSGKGWAYGVDIQVSRSLGRITGSVSYGLMWNWRKFAELNQGLKYPAIFDNRHKINISASYRLNDKIELNATWVFMTGNRLTLALYDYDDPIEAFPDAPAHGTNTELWGNDFGQNYFSGRNNIRIPAYHRLDLGMTYTKRMKNGRMGIWSVGLYNAYCHMNAITIKKSTTFNDHIQFPHDEPWHKKVFQTLSFIPVIPSVSYTYVF